jgi:MoaA/NifB/PqqE/SkfB family radical SAM enzyme
VWKIVKNSRERLRRKDKLTLQVHFADHCNLKCIGCSHFSPLADKKFLDVYLFERDCIRLSQLGKDRIEKIHVLGGEPLLHPKFATLLDITKKYFDNADIIIDTNGLLLLTPPDNFWESCHENKARIRITRYPINLNINKIKILAEKHSVNVDYSHETIKKMRRETLDLHGKQNISRSFKACLKSNDCPQLYEGRIYPCPTIAYIKYFNLAFNEDIQITKSDYIDIYEIESFDDILTFLSKPVPFCRYCNPYKDVYNIDWAMSKANISEWSG